MAPYNIITKARIMEIDAFRIKPFSLIITISLAACGGGNTNTTQQVSEVITSVGMTATVEAKADDLALLNRASTWLTFAGDQPLSAQLRSSPHLTFSNEAESNSTNGLIVSAEFAQARWDDSIKPALDAGRIVVIEALDRADGVSTIEALTSKYLDVGVVGKVVMLSKASGGHQVAGFSANEIAELTNAMRASAQTTE
jgi:hypothetical protein